MRSWKTRAAPDDPNVWSDVQGLWPTKQGTYRTADQYGTPSAKTATGDGGVSYAFCAATVSGTRAYLVGTTKTWEVSTGLTLTDRTGGVGLPIQMAQYGNITIGVCGNATATVSSSGAGFSNLAGAPKGTCIVTQSNAVLIFNTDTSDDGWAASDVGDYTNWTTGEAASGRLLQTPGPILGAVAFQDYVLVWKPSAIYRGRYVGGLVKWVWEVVWRGHGMYYDANNPTRFINCLAVCDNFVAFRGPRQSSTSDGVFSFDGVQARLLNPDADIDVGTSAGRAFYYDPNEKRLFIGGAGQTPYVYSIETDQWGQGTGGSTYPDIIVLGDRTAIDKHYGVHGTLPFGWQAGSGTSSLYSRVSAPSGYSDGALLVSATTSYSGRSDQKTKFTRLTPQLRRRTTTSYGVGNGTSATLDLTHRNERHGGTSVSVTSIAESSLRARFDFTYSDNFASFTVNFNNLDVEIDDYQIAGVFDGKE